LSEGIAAMPNNVSQFDQRFSMRMSRVRWRLVR
jgi:hypothetical protein